MNIEQRRGWWPAQAAEPLTAASAACTASPAAAARRACLTLLLTVAAAAVILFARHPGPLVLSCTERSVGAVKGAPPVAAGPAVELVVAHFDEDLGSLVPRMLPSLGSGAVVTVYSKGKHRPPGATRLPNVGREAHTYLHHLTERYHSLADVTLFVMGSAALSRGKLAALEDLRGSWRRAEAEGFFCSGMVGEGEHWGFYLNSWLGTTDSGNASALTDCERQRLGVPLQPAAPRPFGAWHAEYVGGPLPQAWCPAGFLAVHRRQVQLRGRAAYATLRSQLAAARNPEAAHYMERIWAGLLGSRDAAPTRCSLRLWPS